MRNKALKLVIKEKKTEATESRETKSQSKLEAIEKICNNVDSRKTKSWRRLEESKNIKCYTITRNKAIEQAFPWFPISLFASHVLTTWFLLSSLLHDAISRDFVTLDFLLSFNVL